MMVKVCGITSVEDALAAVDAGATAIGLNFYAKSPRYVSARQAAAISRAAPGVWKVGVFVNESPAAIAAVMEEAGLDIAQLHGDESPDCLPGGGRVWKAFRVTAAFDLSCLKQWPVEAFLLDGPAQAYGGGGEPFDWAAAAGAAHKVILAGGLGPDNVGMAIRTARPWGVDACSRLESAPGRKDRAKVEAFVRAALEELKEVA
jgi:phosphoribosylanthranilate isomerase